MFETSFSLSPGQPRSCCFAQVDLDLRVVLLPQFPKCWITDCCPTLSWIGACTAALLHCGYCTLSSFMLARLMCELSFCVWKLCGTSFFPLCGSSIHSNSVLLFFCCCCLNCFTRSSFTLVLCHSLPPTSFKVYVIFCSYMVFQAHLPQQI